MAYVLRAVYDFYFEYVENKRDLRIDHYFLLGSPFKILSIVTVYLLFVLKVGPKFMEKRHPFELNLVMTVYNSIQVLANLSLLLKALYEILFVVNYNPFKCKAPNYSYTYLGFLEAKLVYYYYLLKVLDLFDTIFFVLRKKANQMTFLHIYHHATMCLAGYLATRYIPGGQATLVGLLNSSVHIVMYSYYIVATYKRNTKQVIWWKQYITQLQLVQFLTISVHFAIPLVTGGCEYPVIWALLASAQNFMMVILFYPRLDHYFLLGSPFKILTLNAMYLYFSLSLGPKLMKHRKAIELNTIMKIYNAIQICANLAVFLQALNLIFNHNYKLFICKNPDFSDSYEALLEKKICYYYYLLKILDLVDTIFIVLRKKSNQISFLHVYHHGMMGLAGYIGARYLPGGQASFLGVINTFVHIVMYTYYFYTSLQLKVKLPVSMKKYITRLQLFQFSVISIHYAVPLLKGGCEYPFFWLLFTFIQNFFMVLLFSDFYYKTYVKKSK